MQYLPAPCNGTFGRPRRVLPLSRSGTAVSDGRAAASGFESVKFCVDFSGTLFLDTNPADSDWDHGNKHQCVASDPHDRSTDVEVSDKGRSPAAGEGVVEREQLVRRRSQCEASKRIDRHGQRKVDKLQRRRQRVSGGLDPHHGTPEQIADHEEAKMLSVVDQVVCERVVIEAGQVGKRDEDGLNLDPPTDDLAGQRIGRLP